jgi:hypothetical protein
MHTSTATLSILAAILAVALVIPAGRAAADERAAPPRNQASVSFMGFAGFLRVNAGSYVFAYERRLTAHHALRVAGDFIHVHFAGADIQAHQWTFGGTLGYRYHFDPAGGVFVGAEIGYRRGIGHVGATGADRDAHTGLQNEQLRVMPEIGVRVPHHRLPLAFVTRVAAGWGPYKVTPTHQHDDAGHAYAQYAQDILGATPLALDVEASLAYAF